MGHGFAINFRNACGAGNLGFLRSAGVRRGGSRAAAGRSGGAGDFSGVSISHMDWVGLPGLWHDARGACDAARQNLGGISLQSPGDGFVAAGRSCLGPGGGWLGPWAPAEVARGAGKSGFVGLGVVGDRILGAAKFTLVAIHAFIRSLN